MNRKPSFERSRRYLINERFPAANAAILWGHDDRQADVVEVRIFRNDDGIPQKLDYLISSRGNIEHDWMEGGNTPAAVYGDMLTDGFDSLEAHYWALRQFGQIEECDWARDIAAAINREMHFEIDDDGDMNILMAG